MKRYAANKSTYGNSSGSSISSASSYSAPSVSYSAGPLKSNGTPDMRYSANKAAYGGGGGRRR